MIAYIDCISGISGDMFLSSLINLGVPVSVIKDAVLTLNIEGIKNFDIKVFKEKRHNIVGTKIEIYSEDTAKSRSFISIKEMIQRSGLPSKIKEKAIKIFEIIACAEAKIHNCKLEEVHFHEISGLDSIVDILGVLIGIDYLGIEEIFCSHIPLGTGTMRSAHGIIPIPAPATLEILKGLPVYGTDIRAELVTPTGAALLKGLSKGFGSMPALSVKKIGYGVGSRDLKERPNLVRLILGELAEGKETDTVALLETHIDDSNPEHLGFLMERLFREGVLDVAYVPIYMKKNRPGVLIKVICQPSDMLKAMDLIFKETTTSGIRYSFLFRKRLKRETIELQTPWGKVRAKRYYLPDGSSYLKPEYEECLNIAKKYAIPLRKIYSYILGEEAE